MAQRGEQTTTAWHPPSSALRPPECLGSGRAECSDRRSYRNARALYRWSADCGYATESARASASATVAIASTSTASCSPKIKVDVIGSKPSASPKGLGHSPTIALAGAVKTFTLSVFDATGGHACGLFQPICTVHLVLLSMSERATVQKNGSPSSTAIPNRLELSLLVQVRVDPPDASAGESIPHSRSSPASCNRRTSPHQARSWQ